MKTILILIVLLSSMGFSNQCIRLDDSDAYVDCLIKANEGKEEPESKQVEYIEDYYTHNEDSLRIYTLVGAGYTQGTFTSFSKINMFIGVIPEGWNNGIMFSVKISNTKPSNIKDTSPHNSKVYRIVDGEILQLNLGFPFPLHNNIFLIPIVGVASVERYTQILDGDDGTYHVKKDRDSYNVFGMGFLFKTNRFIWGVDIEYPFDRFPTIGINIGLFITELN